MKPRIIYQSSSERLVLRYIFEERDFNSIINMATQFVIAQQGAGFEPGLLMYRPNVRRQHGHGIGSFLGAMFSRLLPIAKEYILPHAVNAVKNVANDIVHGVNLKQSLKDNAKGVFKDVTNQVFNQKGSGSRRGKKRRANSSQTKSKKAKQRKTSTHKKSKSKKPKSYSSKSRRQLKKSDFITLFD